MGIHGVTRDYRGLQGVTWGYKGLQGVTGGTRGYKGLQGVTGGEKGLRWVTKDYRNFSLSRTCLLYTSPSPRDGLLSRMPSSA